ncbi:hypothetical protein BGZ94_002706, partial [Podila epigama]
MAGSSTTQRVEGTSLFCSRKIVQATQNLEELFVPMEEQTINEMRNHEELLYNKHHRSRNEKRSAVRKLEEVNK